MKRFLALLIAMMLLLCAVSCGDDTVDPAPDDDPIDGGFETPIIPILPSN